MPLLVFLDRSRKADEYPWLLWKVRLFVIGAGLAVGGMLLEMDWVVFAAIVVLAAAFLVRFLPGGRGEVKGDEGPGGEGLGEEEPERGADHEAGERPL